MLKSLFLFFTTFLFVIGFVPNTMYGIYLDFMPFTNVVIILCGIIFYKNIIISNQIKPIIYLFWGIAFYIFSVGTIFSSYSFNEIHTLNKAYLSPIRILLTLHGGIFLFNFYLKHYGDNYLLPLIRNIFLSLSINNVLIILEAFLPTVKEFLRNFKYTLISPIHFQTWNRPGGLLYSGGAMPSVLAGLSLPLLAFLSSLRKINYLYLLILFIFTNIAIVLTGRTGLFYTAIFFILFPMVKEKKAFDFKKVFTIALLVITLVTLYERIGYIVERSHSELVEFNINRLTRLFSYDSFYDSAGYRTVNSILTKFSLPIKLSHLFFGDISFSVYRTPGITDMGYAKSIWEYGLFGATLYYFPILIVLKDSFVYRVLDKKFLFYLFFFYSYLLIEFKEQAIYSRNIFPVFVLIALCMYRDVSKIKALTLK